MFVAFFGRTLLDEMHQSRRMCMNSMEGRKTAHALWSKFVSARVIKDNKFKSINDLGVSVEKVRTLGKVSQQSKNVKVVSSLGGDL